MGTIAYRCQYCICMVDRFGEEPINNFDEKDYKCRACYDVSYSNKLVGLFKEVYGDNLSNIFPPPQSFILIKKK